jgi:hypothetical protein
LLNYFNRLNKYNGLAGSKFVLTPDHCLYIVAKIKRNFFVRRAKPCKSSSLRNQSEPFFNQGGEEMSKRFLLTTMLAGLFVFVCSAGALAPTAIAAEEFPTKPVTLVIPVGAGGSHDLTARAVTSVASNYLGQPIIIQLKPGGGGAIGSEIVAKSAPDGYTLLFGGMGWSTTYPAVEGRSKGPDDLMAVCRINYSPTIIVSRPDLPFKTFKEMLAYLGSGRSPLEDDRQTDRHQDEERSL